LDTQIMVLELNLVSVLQASHTADWDGALLLV
jgi:hypothetical protein